ncbi:FCD domain-containing protein [Pelagibius sp. 7325]|uniref:FadR/GntR family transcriptional regulator n=1 Tax=Pelagibius sp. 7325 TaxID=3131994 RepID=UPI0030EB5BFA
MSDSLDTPAPPDAPKRRGMKRPASIAEEMKDFIVLHGLKPGDRLPGERELIARFQASKGTIRESLRVLETQGLVRSRTGPGGGTFVEALSESRAMELLGNYFFFQNPTIGDIYALRRILEPALAASVAGRLQEADFKRLEQTMQIYVDPPCDLEEERRQRHAELDFHSILVDYCPNPVLAFMCRFLQSLLRDLTLCKRIYEEPNPDLRESGLSYQVRLLRALRRADAETARQVMFEHMCTAQRYMEDREAVLQAKFLQISD